MVCDQKAIPKNKFPRRGNTLGWSVHRVSDDAWSWGADNAAWGCVAVSYNRLWIRPFVDLPFGLRPGLIDHIITSRGTVVVRTRNSVTGQFPGQKLSTLRPSASVLSTRWNLTWAANPWLCRRYWKMRKGGIDNFQMHICFTWKNESVLTHLTVGANQHLSIGNSWKSCWHALQSWKLRSTTWIEIWTIWEWKCHMDIMDVVTSFIFFPQEQPLISLGTFVFRTPQLGQSEPHCSTATPWANRHLAGAENFLETVTQLWYPSGKLT